jgi:hypothetical protein
MAADDKNTQLAALAEDLDGAKLELAERLRGIDEKLHRLTGAWRLAVSRDDGSLIGSWEVPLDEPFEWSGEGLVVKLQP